MRLLAVAAIFATACATGDLPEDHDPDNADVTFTDRAHVMPLRDPGAIHPDVSPPGAHLQYFGGKVIQNVKVDQVLYGSGTYIPEITGAQAGNFYQQFMSSGVMDWLNEYNTTSPAQTIGRGGFDTQISITPSSANNAATIDDSNIQAELAAQINAGKLPAPDDNRIYMVNFRKGQNITQGGSQSCAAGGFCAYHGTFKIGSQNVYYGVLPDMTGGCATGCGGAPTTFQNQTSVSSHELIEAVTDAEVGLATVLGPPLAWYDNNNGEIGDICNGQQGTFVGNDGITYTMQQEFSNQQSDCITTRSVSTTPDFTVAVAPGSATVQPGGTATYSIATTAVNGSTQAVALTATGLPTGVTATISPSSVTAGGSATLTVTAASTAPAATATLSVTGTSGTTTHSATTSLTVGQSTGGTITLTNGVGLGSQSGAKNQQTNYVIAVPAGQASLKVTISGGSGDADLYVKFGAAPTLSTFDCRPFITGNSETCTFTNPAAGNWFIMLNGFAAYSGVTVTATFAADTTTALSNNVPVTGLSGSKGSSTFFKITVPAGQTQLVVHTSGGSGDADLYVRKGSKPTTSTFDCRPFINGNNETCTITSPVAADYFIMLRGFASYSGVSLVAHFP